MVNNKNSVFITAIAILFFLSVGWLSCDKSSTLQRCEGVLCDNGGYCHFDTAFKTPKCICPTGFEGPTCATVTVKKYIGTWDLRQIITGSDSTGFNNDTTYYSVSLKATATTTTFFIDNFGNNPYYNQIVCSLDSVNSNKFTIDTVSAYHMLFDHFSLLYGSGTLSSDGSVINAGFAVRHLSATSNWINDTVNIRLTPHK